MTTSVEGPTSQGWVPDFDSFGARLALVRQRMGWSNVKEAATACGLPAENWRRWERGEAEPRRLITIAMTIATKTGCDYLWLVHGPDRGGTVRRSAYVGQRVIARVAPQSDREASPRDHPVASRSVRQTRPVVGAFNRPRTPVAV